MTQDLTTRPLWAEDEALLVRATVGNLNWREERFSDFDVRRRPEFRHYTRPVPERGDFGLVAERAGEPIGVAWALLLPADEPGYGFLDESTPEISLWVRQDSRGTGIGGCLLERLQQQAIDRGYDRLSLSVEDGNNARKLYAANGFTQVEGREADGVMLWVASDTENSGSGDH